MCADRGSFIQWFTTVRAEFVYLGVRGRQSGDIDKRDQDGDSDTYDLTGRGAHSANC